VADRPGRVGEETRQIVHLAMLLGLPLLRLLPASALLPFLLLAAAAILVTGPFLLPSFTRPGESPLSLSFEILSFPLAASILLLLFPERAEVAGAAWGILAAGDGAAGLLGARWKGAPLPWNGRKSVGGTLSFCLAGLAGGLFGFFLWGGEMGSGPLLPLAAAVLWAALQESLPLRLGDNLPVGLGGGILFGLLGSGAGWGPLPSGLWAGLLLILAFGIAGERLRFFDGNGAGAGFVIGAGVFVAAGWGALLLLFLFVAAGSLAGRLRKGGRRRRTIRHALANLVAPLFAALLVGAGGGWVAKAAFAGALIAALSDTLSGEIGLLSRRPPRLILGWQVVPPGTDGAITPLGTATGAAVAMVGAGAAWLGGLLPPSLLIPVAAAGFAGSVADSLLGASVERTGAIGNEEVNFLCTLTGGALAALAAAFLHGA